MASLDSQLLYRCLCAMMGNWPRLETRGVDAIFIWGRADGEWRSSEFDDGVLKRALELHRHFVAPLCFPSYVGADFNQGENGRLLLPLLNPLSSTRGLSFSPGIMVVY